MKTLTLFTLLFCVTSFTSKAAIPSGPELEKLKAGKLIKKVEDLKGEIWPRITIQVVIPHTPKANMEVFDDFERQKDFIPDMISAKVIRKLENNAYDVAFEMEMPWPISNTKYVTRNTIRQNGNDYRIDWHLIKSNQMKATTGSVIFQALGEDKTIFTYVSHITPDSEFASMFKSRVSEDVEKTVKIIMKHLEKNVR